VRRRRDRPLDQEYPRPERRRNCDDGLLRRGGKKGAPR
jgi:hypothetical protein